MTHRAPLNADDRARIVGLVDDPAPVIPSIGR